MTTEAVIVVAADPALRARLMADLTDVAKQAFTVEAFAAGATAIDRVEELLDSGLRVPIVFVHLDVADGSGVDTLVELNGRAATRRVRKVLVESDVTAEQLDTVIRARSLDSILPVPWELTRLREQVQRLLTEYLVAEAPEEVAGIGELADIEVLSGALATSEEERKRAEGEIRSLRRSFLDDRAMSDDEVEAAMMAELEHTLGIQPRVRVPAGTVLLESGLPVDVIRVVVEGRVRLTLPVDDEETTFHSRTAGRIVGLLSIAHGESSFFTVVAATDVTFIALSVDQLDAALRDNPSFAVHFVSVLLRAMARRNRRSAELQITVRKLAADLEAERDRLRETLAELARTQGRLVESEKLAMLGQLSAGISHELNNPVAAVGRAAAHLQEDVEAVLAAAPDGNELIDAVRLTRNMPPLSTRDERAARKRLGAELGDETVATRLARMGIADLATARRLLGAGSPATVDLERLERAGRMGGAIRAISSSADRIAALVRSVKSYARPGERWVNDLDLNAGIEESLVLLGYELREREVVKDFGEIPPLAGSPGELNQVWTNLLTNAVQATEPGGEIHIATRVDHGIVRVDIEDTGHGIPPEDLARVFEPSFTTRRGRIEFGLGLGLQIAREIVRRHHGSIGVTSRPGRTCFAVTLPLANLPPGKEQT